VSQSNKGRYFGGGDQPSSFFMKETLIAWSIFGRGNPDMEANEEMLSYYLGFERILIKILPKELRFKRFSIRNSEIVLECDTGEFLIDAASGGVSSIIDMAWQIYMYSEDKTKKFTVLIDEVENHLHPSMQRHLLPDFVTAFPNVKFIVSTHSPLIVGSVKNSEVYVLRFNGNNKIVAEYLDFSNKAKSASEILDEVLGVSFTMPLWAENSLNEIVQKFLNKSEITEGDLGQMREELSQSGLENLMPRAITKIVLEKT
jgi:Predicted ATP-binding protein involved in virulence